ncbi:50S ribosomal protein L3 [Candidatus Phytoplasma australiense]|uniref:Large ribosomal subunit protein uL3 n=2 Tax=Phytoplasma australiense TaxID=59748 RepID=RL3_PHYAS|nr:50S ribosomal protein L3 [Candidatus Phytoplasma australiense]B1VAE8.1 RecName: Full=Large ribosomal subunit protein uL3; AltName: Full=50S ribosomal protein L3 [Candidatus Phytoplasma australiense]AGL90308.1 50S ribosomal protein L3 [Strawberry lethal yellows phytoplasma (CPA) str. NZSb11]CAM11921.1 50S ribosomal protein L3 [Candidatus Phytoplasma australiense]
MAQGILGKKIGMTQMFNEQGEIIPITIVDVSANVVLQQKNVAIDGYNATQIGFDDKKDKITTKPMLGHFKKAKTTPKRFIKEIIFKKENISSLSALAVGDQVSCDLFQVGDLVDVTGTSKGKGFAGVIKRHNQSRGPETHGSRHHRRPGSMGPIKGKIKGKKLPGQMGHQTVTIQNLVLFSVDNQKNLFLIKGSVPGPNKGFVVIKSAVKKLSKEQANAKI